MHITTKMECFLFDTLANNAFKIVDITRKNFLHDKFKLIIVCIKPAGKQQCRQPWVFSQKLQLPGNQQ